MTDTLTPDEIAALFTRADGQFLFARWGRPIVPVVFGTDDATLSVVKGAVEAVVALAGHQMAETDPELGANLMLFFFRDWRELPEVPGLDRLMFRLSEDGRASECGSRRDIGAEPDRAERAAMVGCRVSGLLGSGGPAGGRCGVAARDWGADPRQL